MQDISDRLRVSRLPSVEPIALTTPIDTPANIVNHVNHVNTPMNETETRVELIDPALKDKAGWGAVEGSRYNRLHTRLKG